MSTFTIAVGRSYRLRNGQVVRIINRRIARVMGKEFPFWVGAFNGAEGRITFQENGQYSPVTKSQLDIVAPARTRK